MLIRLFTLLIFILPIAGPTHAQSDGEEVRYYDVEIIIFKNTRGPKGKELILPVSSPRKDREILDLSSPASIKAAAAKFYQVLTLEQLQLNDRVEKIVKSPYYDLLAHVGWRQPGLELEKAMPIWIRGGRIFGEEYVSIDNHMMKLMNSASNEFTDNSSGIEISPTTASPPPEDGTIYELEGKITIALARYLHAYTDMVLRRPRFLPDTALETTQQTQLTLEDQADIHILDNYSLKEHRRMRSKKLHYLDNPEFGMVILITPYEVEEPVAESTQIQ